MDDKRKSPMEPDPPANAEGIHRLQSFGGVLSGFRQVGGFRVSFHVEAGNHFSTICPNGSRTSNSLTGVPFIKAPSIFTIGKAKSINGHQTSGTRTSNRRPKNRRSPANAAGTLLADVTIVDIASGTLQPDQSVLIRDDLVAEVGPNLVAQTGAQVIDGDRGFLIPGLWDSQVHKETILGLSPLARLRIFIRLGH
jgi:hypothetical protein